jgi:hypothetical protein
MWWRCLHWLIAVVLVAVSAYALNSFVDAKRLEELRVAQLADDTLRQLRVPSSPTPLQVRCDVVGKRIGTFFHVPGAGCSWIYNAIPLWKLPQLVPGVEVCTFSRQGLPFSDGSPNNATDEAVELLVRQVLELILTQTTDRNSPLWISGHSYGTYVLTWWLLVSLQVFHFSAQAECRRRWSRSASSSPVARQRPCC